MIGICPLNPRVILRQIECLHLEAALEAANKVIRHPSNRKDTALSDELNSLILGTPLNSRNFKISFKSLKRLAK